jgi:hypothetical protein
MRAVDHVDIARMAKFKSPAGIRFEALPMEARKPVGELSLGSLIGPIQTARA